MRRSSAVFAPLLGSLAVSLLSGCHTVPEMQRCVDSTNHVVDPAMCKTVAGHGSSGAYHYYYGGTGSAAPGTLVSGGAATPHPGHTYSTTTGTERGGFGSSFDSPGAEGGAMGAAGEASGAGE